MFYIYDYVFMFTFLFSSIFTRKKGLGSWKMSISIFIRIYSFRRFWRLWLDYFYKMPIRESVGMSVWDRDFEGSLTHELQRRIWWNFKYIYPFVDWFWLVFGHPQESVPINSRIYKIQWFKRYVLIYILRFCAQKSTIQHV